MSDEIEHDNRGLMAARLAGDIIGLKQWVCGQMEDNKSVDDGVDEMMCVVKSLRGSTGIDLHSSDPISKDTAKRLGVYMCKWFLRHADTI